MEVVVAVVRELWLFVREKLIASPEKEIETETVAVQAVTPTLLPAPQPFKKLASLPEQKILPAANVLSDEQNMYVVTKQANVYCDPVEAFDGRVAVLNYGDSVELGRRSGRFVYVVNQKEIKGWILLEQIGTGEDTFPKLVPGKKYEFGDDNTSKLRALIDDAFCGEVSGSPLTPEEYVTYRLIQAGRHIPWSQTWGRVPGTWQRKLRGVRGVHIDITPHTGSVMEFIIDDCGYLAFVEQVAPDLRITVSAVGLFYSGQYTERVMEYEDWREFRPVFIQIV